MAGVRQPGLLLLGAVVAAVCAAWGEARADTSAPAGPVLGAAFDREVRPVLAKHCVACHGAEKPKGGVRLDGPAPDLTDPMVSEKWLLARRLLAQGEMPPEGKPRPTADELLAAMNWIEDAAARAAVATRGGVGRRALRRLTNREYVSTLHDLLGLSFPHAAGDLSTRLPSDAIANTFSNDSNSQVTQALLLRRSLDLAEDLLAVALPAEGTVKPFRYDVDLRALVAEKHRAFTLLPEASRKGQRGPAIQNVVIPAQVKGGEPARLGVQGGPNSPLAIEHVDPARGLMLEPNPITTGVNRNAITLALPFVPEGGVLRVRVRAAAVMEHDESAPVLRLCFGGPHGPGNVAYPVAGVTVTATEPKEYVLEVPVLLAECDWKSFRREKRLLVQIDNAAALLGPTATPENYDSKKRETYLRRNRLLLESFHVEIDAAPTWPAGSESVLRVSRFFFFGRGMSWPAFHRSDNLPLLLAGGEGVGFVQGRHVAFNGQRPVVAVAGQAPPVTKDLGRNPACVSDLLRTISERVGVEARGFGESRRTLDELLA